MFNSCTQKVDGEISIYKYVPDQRSMQTGPRLYERVPESLQGGIEYKQRQYNSLRRTPGILQKEWEPGGRKSRQLDNHTGPCRQRQHKQTKIMQDPHQKDKDDKDKGRKRKDRSDSPKPLADQKMGRSESSSKYWDTVISCQTSSCQTSEYLNEGLNQREPSNRERNRLESCWCFFVFRPYKASPQALIGSSYPWIRASLVARKSHVETIFKGTLR